MVTQLGFQTSHLRRQRKKAENVACNKVEIDEAHSQDWRCYIDSNPFEWGEDSNIVDG
jgi:hypothetical protein